MVDTEHFRTVAKYLEAGGLVGFLCLTLHNITTVIIIT